MLLDLVVPASRYLASRLLKSPNSELDQAGAGYIYCLLEGRFDIVGAKLH